MKLTQDFPPIPVYQAGIHDGTEKRLNQGWIDFADAVAARFMKAGHSLTATNFPSAAAVVGQLIDGRAAGSAAGDLLQFFIG